MHWRKCPISGPILNSYPIFLIPTKLFSARCIINNTSHWFSSSSLPPPQTQQPILRLCHTCRDARPKQCIQDMFYCRSGAKRCLEEVQIAPKCDLLCINKIAIQRGVPLSGHSTISLPCPAQNHTNRESTPWMNTPYGYSIGTSKLMVILIFWGEWQKL